MTSTIWKFPFEVEHLITINAPVDLQPLRVGCDPEGTPCIWGRVSSDATKKDFLFGIVGTGHPIPGNFGAHIGTFNCGPFVWHVFHVQKKSP